MLRFKGLIITPDGTLWHEIGAEGRVEDAAAIGAKAGADVREKAGTQFFEGWF
jgi:hydroxymethylbilane synthase